MNRPGTFEENNKAAEKWTEETVMPIIERIKEHSKSQDCYWLGSALVHEGLYKEIWAYWKEKFKDNETVFKSIKAVDTIFEDKLFRMALNGTYNATVSIFGLKNNHDWKDKQEIEQTHHIEDMKSNQSQIFKSDTGEGVSDS